MSVNVLAAVKPSARRLVPAKVSEAQFKIRNNNPRRNGPTTLPPLIAMSPAPNAFGGAWRARPNGTIPRTHFGGKPSFNEIMSPVTWGSGPDLVMCGSRAVAAPRRTPAVAAVVVPRPARRVTFAAASGGAYPAAPAEAAAHQQHQSQLPQSGANSVADIAGVANWLRNRRLTANKESLRIKIVVNRRFSSVQRGASEEAASSSSFVRRPGLRRFSSIAAIDSAKVPPTVGPPPAPDGGGCTEATSAAAVALLRCCRESDDAALHQLIAGVDGLRLRPSDVNTFDASGRTAVSYVASGGSLAMLEALAQFPGVDFNFPDKEGNAPLHFAAQAGHVEVLNLLLSQCTGVEVDPRNSLGFTPLMKAALQGRTKSAKLLLFAGASPALRDLGRGLRAEQWAHYCGRHMCAEVIEKFSRHRLLERSGAAPAGGVGGRWGSEPELCVQQCAPQQPASGGGSSWFKSKLKRAFKSAAPESPPTSKAASRTQQQQPELAPPVAPRVFIVPKVQVTPAGVEAAASATPEANARRKK